MAESKTNVAYNCMKLQISRICAKTFWGVVSENYSESKNSFQ